MNRNSKILVIFLCISFVSFSQSKLNNYKYIIVPNQFEFQKTPDAFKINSLTKFLFNKAGFTTFLTNDVFPNDLAKNRCLALTAKLVKAKGLFKTKISIDLLNCNNEVVYATKIAESREKDYKTAYHKAIREAFEDVKRQHYNYTPTKDETVKTIEETATIKQVYTSQNNAIKSKKTADRIVENTEKTLFVQPIENGFQLVDKTPKIVFVIKETSVKNVFILEGKNGIMYKSNQTWFAEYYKNGMKIKEKLVLKF